MGTAAPGWWPASLRGVLSIVELEARGEYRTPDLPRGLEPWGVNMVVERSAMLDLGGFDERVGRYGDMLLSDEDVQLAWRLQATGRPVRYDSRIVVQHSVQAGRFSPEWLLSRLYWQGFSTVVTRRLLREPGEVRREMARRLAVEVLCAPVALLAHRSTRLLALRWRLAYAKGFTRSALGCVAGKRAAPLRLALGRLGIGHTAAASGAAAALLGATVLGEPQATLGVLEEAASASAAPRPPGPAELDS